MLSNSEPYIVVIGGVNIDIGGRPFAPLIVKDSNPGKVSVSLGGVGRNIAHNACLLGLPVVLFSALGDDVYGHRVEETCSAIGIDMEYVLWAEGEATSTYLFVCDQNGDMSLAISDMSVCEHITPDYLSQYLPVINQSAAVALDTNIPQETLIWLTENCTAPLFVDPVSTRKAEKLKPVLGSIHTLKPNRLEAELLSGIQITDEKSLEMAADALLGTGLARVIITLGSEGVYAADHEQKFHIPCLPAVMKNATGAGDSFLAALLWAHVRNIGIAEACRIASAAAALTVESSETIYPAMSVEMLRMKLSHDGNGET